MHDFVFALMGGAMIGLAAGLVMAVEGRVMGISGIVSSLLPGASPADPLETDPLDTDPLDTDPLGTGALGTGALDTGARAFGWRGAFIAGVVLAPVLSLWVFDYQPPVSIKANPIVLSIAGLIVGVGTVMGNGCTSGHGVCGLARFSTRSFAATLIFMVTAVATVAVVQMF